MKSTIAKFLKNKMKDALIGECVVCGGTLKRNNVFQEKFYCNDACRKNKLKGKAKQNA